MADPDRKAPVWEGHRVDALSGAFIDAASTAGLGVSLVSMKPPVPRVVYISDKGVEILGHPREVILTRSARDFLAPDEHRARRRPASAH